jgi:hypothetical protein
MSTDNVLTFAAVVRLSFEPAWLALPRGDRRVWATRVNDLSVRYPKVSLAWYDSDALGSGYTDFVICRFSDFASYHFLWEELRDLELFSRPYVRIVDVTLGIERGYEAFERSASGE